MTHARTRIGKVTLKGGATILPLHRDRDLSHDERRADFLQAVTQSYDRYVSDFGQRPDAVVYILGGVRQSARAHWAVDGDSRGAATSMLAFAHAVLGREVCA